MQHRIYTKGEKYKHTAARETDISVMLNRQAGLRIPGFSALSPDVIRVACYNSTADEIPAGSAVMFSQDKTLCDEDIIPIEKYSDESKHFAVLENSLEKDQIGNAVIGGPVAIDISGTALDYVVPDVSSTGSFKYSESGTARVLYSDSEKAIVLLGATSGNIYNGSFKVELEEGGTLKVSAGYLNRNGEFSTVEAKNKITPKSGVLCLYSTIKDGKWTDPEYKIIDPAADAYPVAEITVDEDKNVAVKQYHVSVAIILLAKVCPLTKKE